MNKRQKEEIKKERIKITRKKYLVIFGGIIASIAIPIGLMLFTETIDRELVQMIITIVIGFIGLGYFLLMTINTLKEKENNSVAEGVVEEDQYDLSTAFEDDEIDEAEQSKDYIIVCDRVVGRFYQCIKRDNDYLFIHVGNLFTGLHLEEILTLEEAQNFKKFDKKNFLMNKSEIDSIEFGILFNQSANLGFGVLYFHLGNKQKEYEVFINVSENDLCDFFEGINFSPKKNNDKKKKRYEKNLGEPVPDKVSQKKYKVIKISYHFINFLAIVLLGLFLFSDFNFTVNSILLILCYLANIVLYIVFPDHFTLFEYRIRDETKRKKVFSGIPFFTVPAFFGIRAMIDYNVIKWGNYFIFSLIFSVILFVILFICSRERKNHKSVILVFILISLIFGFSVTLNVNDIFDRSIPTISVSEVYEKEISESSDGPDMFYLHLKTSDGKLREIKVSRSFFETVVEGDLVEVYQFEGALGIPYVFVYEE